jgi:NADPH-dependent 2,4-dienoyl-CoA reductase/sulfur reductase-like enzyme
MSKKNNNRKNIVIVGGGAGGSTLARSLSKTLDASKYNLVVIDPRESLILSPSTIRLPVANPNGLDNKVFVPLKDIFINNNGTFHQGKVVSIVNEVDNREVVLENGERLPYDTLVLSPGSLWYGSFAGGSDPSQVRAGWAADRESVKAAQSVVLVGAGAVGLGMSRFSPSDYFRILNST